MKRAPFTYAEARALVDNMWDDPEQPRYVFKELVARWVNQGTDSVWSLFSRCKDLELVAKKYGIVVRAHTLRRHLVGERDTPRIDQLGAIISTILRDLKENDGKF